MNMRDMRDMPKPKDYGRYPKWVAKTLDDQLPYPHYSGPAWYEENIVYGSREAKSDDGAYSDRLAQWDDARYKAAWAAVTADRATPRAIQEYLSAYYDRPVELVEIMFQVRRDNGFNVAYYRWNWLD